MKRAAVLVGVKKAGNLPPLKDALDGVVLMENWCKAQQYPRQRSQTKRSPFRSIGSRPRSSPWPRPRTSGSCWSTSPATA